MILTNIIGESDYVKDSFTFMMRKLLNDQFWYQFLKDVIQEEAHCSQNFLGVDHVDFPALMGKTLLSFIRCLKMLML